MERIKMKRIIGYEIIWEGSFDCDDLDGFLDTGEPFYFKYRGSNYMIEGDSGSYMIVDPFLYYPVEGKPQSTEYAYPYHNEAKTAEQLKQLPFLDGKTIVERLPELVFFDVFAIFDQPTKQGKEKHH